MVSYNLPPQNIPTLNDLGYELKIWKPSLTKWIPKGLPLKYIIYSIFHFLRVFKNRNYCVVLVMEGKDLASSMLLIPSHFKWPFMKKNDLQFCYSITKPKFRGKGINTSCKADLMRKYITKNANVGFWCVLDDENIANKRVLTKLGLKKIADSYRVNKLFSLIRIVKMKNLN